MNKKINFAMGVLVGICIGFVLVKTISVQKSSKISNTTKTQILIGEFPECRFDRCPTFFSVDVDGDHLPESLVVQPTAMTQGAGQVLVIKNGKVIFQSDELPQLSVKPYDGENGFILEYSSPRDENGNTSQYEVRYEFKNGQFVVGKPIKTGSISSTPQTPEEEAKSLVIKFEDLQKKRNSDVLKLFTPSASKEEADTYSFLMALDLENSSPRLFKTAGFGYKVIEYKLGSILKAEKGFRVEVEEARSSYDNTGGGWVNVGKKVYVFELVHIGGNIMVDKYYPKDGNHGKYDGFL